jgi:hypothetical protein
MNIIDKIKKTDFSYVAAESKVSSEVLKVEVQIDHIIRVDIYHSKDNGYFPIIRNFFGKDNDRELNCYQTLSEAKQALKKNLK